jgi:hypothetical protein
VIDRVKAPAALHLEYDLTSILAYGLAALVVVLGVAIIVGVTAGYVMSMRRESK